MTQAIKHIILDWNGTLIDDVHLAVEGVNRVRAHQALPAINITTYRDLFAFPIKAFYERLGIDFVQLSFNRLAEIYLNHFNERLKSCSLHEGTHDLLACARDNSMSISILSASKHDTLLSNLTDAKLMDQIDRAFGLRDNEAGGKIDLAHRLDAELGHPGANALMIGDTDHDIEVAQACGWQVSAVSHGHQASHRLEKIHGSVFPNLTALRRHHFPKADSEGVIS